MYPENEIEQLYERLKTQYPQYGLELSGDCLTLTRLHSRVEVDRDGAKLYVNGNLYDQFTSEDVEDPDDLYELIEAFLLDLQHAGMKQGNETYIAATKQAVKIGSRILILTIICLVAIMTGLIFTNNPWLSLSFFLLPAVSIIIRNQIRKKVFQRYWVCPACNQPLPMSKRSHSGEMWSMCPNAPTAGRRWKQRRIWSRSKQKISPQSRWDRSRIYLLPAASGPVCGQAVLPPPLPCSCSH